MVILLVIEDPASNANSNTQTHVGRGHGGVEGQNNEHVRRMLHIDLTYFKTIPGILKILQFALTLLIKVLPRPPYMDYVVQLTFILTSLWIWIYVFSLHQKYTIKPTWIDLEFFYTVGATFLYVVMTIITFADASFYFRAAIFGLFNCFAFGGGTFLLFKDWQEFRQNRINTSQQPARSPDEPNNAGYI